MNEEYSSPEELRIKMQLLHEITSNSGEDLETQLNFALRKVTQLLDMELGIISMIEEDRYIIRNFYPDTVDLSLWQVFSLENTYCSITIQEARPLTIKHMKESQYHDHPCYSLFELEAYIGIPVMVDGELYGTINFSSSKPKSTDYLPSDTALMQLLSAWVGNIIRRIQIEDELVKKNEQFKLISSNSADLSCLHDLEGNYLFVSPSVKRILGYEIEDLIGRNHYDLVHPDDIERLRKNPHQQLLDGKIVSSTQYRIRHQSGKYIWFESSVTPIMDEQGNPVQLQSVSRDITSRKRTEYLFSEAQRMANVGGWEYDIESGDIFWTEEVYRIHGLEPGGEIDVENALSFFPGESSTRINEALEKAVSEGISYDLKLEFLSAKGEKKWVRAIGKPIIEYGQTKAIMGTFQDITRQVEFEQKIVEQNKALNQNDLTKKKLYSIIGHDLKGSFFGIIGLLEFLFEDLEQEQISEEHLENLTLVINSARNAQELLENLLKWIRYQDTELMKSVEVLTLRELLDECIQVLGAQSAKKNIQFKNDAKPVTIEGDRNMLSTVFRNIISNAIKYSRPDSDIQISSKEIGEDQVEVHIEDFGIGMSPEVIENLFNKEYRPQRLGTEKERGTGLGLILCQELIEIHNGKIWVESSEGKGSKFIIILPKHSQNEP